MPDHPYPRTTLPDTPSQPRLPAQGRLGNYEILSLLGRGGMGTVYRARHRNLQTLVALKTLSPRVVDDATAVARFYREMAAVGAVVNPHVVRALDAGEVDGVHYLAMEFVQGIDLAKLVNVHGPLATPDACEIVRQAALGLAAIDARQLVHRDVKPSNLFLSTDGVVKVLDLGLARLVAEQHASAEASGETASGVTLGTADYMAPEQAQDARGVDIRADIYSLGCTLYALLNGTPPYAGPKYSSRSSKIAAHLYQAFPPLRPGVSLPVGAADVLRRLVAKDRAERIGSPNEVAELLRPFTIGSDLRRLADGAAPSDASSDWTTESVPDSTDPLSAAITATKPMPIAARRSIKPALVVVCGLLLLVGVGVFAWISSGSRFNGLSLLGVGEDSDKDAERWSDGEQRPPQGDDEEHLQQRDETPPPAEDKPTTAEGLVGMVPVSPVDMTLPVDYDQFPKLDWHSLLNVPPHPYVWEDDEGTGTWKHEPDTKQIFVMASGYSLLQMGHTSSLDYELQLKVRQGRTTSGVGLFFAHRREEESTDPQKSQCQLIELRATVDEQVVQKFALRRSKFTYWRDATGKFRWQSRSLMEMPVKAFEGDCRLAIKVERGHLREVSCNGVAVERMTAPEANDRFQVAENTGGFGVYNYASGSVYREAEIKIYK